MRQPPPPSRVRPQTSQWTDVHPSQLLGPPVVFQEYDMATVTVDELKVCGGGGGAWEHRAVGQKEDGGSLGGWLLDGTQGGNSQQATHATNMNLRRNPV